MINLVQRHGFKLDIFKLSELEASAQDGVDLKFSLLRNFG